MEHMLQSEFITNAFAPSTLQYLDVAKDVRQALGLHPKDVLKQSMTLAPNETRCLFPETPATHMQTFDVDEYKGWMGISDAEIRSGKKVGLNLPDGFNRQDTSLAALKQIAQVYIWGDSSPLKSFRELLNQRFAPFETWVVVFESLTLQASSTFILRGRPVVLLADTIVLHDDAMIQIETYARLGVNHLKKEGKAA